MKRFKMALLLVACLAPLLAHSQWRGRGGGRYGHFQEKERYILNMYDAHYRGQNTVFLKRELKQQYPGVRPRDLDLIAIRLVAKSKFGQGEATLVVGHQLSYPVKVDGRPNDFHSNAPYTYDRVRIDSPANRINDDGVWQLDLRGNFKIKKIVLITRDEFNAPRRRRVQTIRLSIYDHMRGQSIIPLKQELLQQNPRINFQQMELVSVQLKAKSKHGRGKASLIVGHQETYPQNIGGFPRDFHNNAPYSFDTIYLSNPSWDSFGKWQIRLQGNIKVQQILVTVKQKGFQQPPRGRGGRGGHRRY